MRTRSIAICFLTLAFSAAASAQSFSGFWLRFKSAVDSGDKPAIAAMTKLPFSLGYDQIAKGGEAFLRSKTSFLHKYKYIFDGEVDAKKCFASAVPEKAKTGYAVACSFRSEPPGSERPFIYSFTRTKKGWRFAVFENINE
jgi:hypothetical protein